jgi:uncharacterized surface protein with fasciclin (FAS1) repeats
MRDPAALAKVLTYDVVSGGVSAADALKLTEGGKEIPVEALNGAKLHVSSGGLVRKKVRVNGAKVIVADLAASNGISHVVSRGLFPS